MNTNVNLEIAKTLHEKGFETKFLWSYILGFKTDIEREKYLPTIAEVVMWLWETYKIWIAVDLDDDDSFVWVVRGKLTIVDNEKTPEQAYQTAILLALKNLI